MCSVRGASIFKPQYPDLDELIPQIVAKYKVKAERFPEQDGIDHGRKTSIT